MVSNMKKNIKVKQINNKSIDKEELYKILMIGFTILFDITVVLAMFMVRKYSNFSKSIFILINVLCIVLLLLVNLIYLVIARSKKQNNKLIYSIAVGVLGLLLVVANYYIIRINSSVDKITETGDTIKENVEVSFITYNNNLILQESDINGSKFGVLANESSQEGNVLAKAEIEAKGYSVTYVEYDSYVDLFLGLASGNVDVASLPSNYVELLSPNDGFDELLEQSSAIYTFSKVVEVANETNTSVDITKDPFNILLIGNDGGRSDALILVTFNPSTLEATMISIPRDTYVPIACYTNNARDKINHARAQSRQCTIDTVEDLFDTEINFYAETNFDGVVDIVDALGGIQIDSPAEFDAQNSDATRGTYSVHIFKGVQMVDGEGALAYARERHAFADGDYARGQHQQEVIQAMITAAYGIRDVNKLLTVLDAAGDNLTTNMSLDQITTLLNYLMKTMSSTYVGSEKVLKIDTEQIPGYASNYYNYDYGLPLWISIPYKGGISDAKALITKNLIKSSEKTLTVPGTFEYDIRNYYVSEKAIASYYDEELEVIEMPDFMPKMIGGNYLLSDAQSWANARGITLNVTYVVEGDADYSASLPDGYILSQSVSYGTLTSNFSSLSISVIQQLSEEDKVPNFVGSNYSELVNWANNNGYSYSINWISGDSSNAGQVSSQSIASGTNKHNYTSISCDVHDYPDVTSGFTSNASTVSSMKSWASSNLLGGEGAISVTEYEYTTDSTKNDKVISWSATNYTGSSGSNTVKTNSTISVKAYTTNTEYAAKYTVTVINGNSNTSTTVTTGSTYTIPSADAKEGFTFNGWTVNGNAANAGDTITITGNTTIEAKYTQNANSGTDGSGTDGNSSDTNQASENKTEG